LLPAQYVLREEYSDGTTVVTSTVRAS